MTEARLRDLAESEDECVAKLARAALSQLERKRAYCQRADVKERQRAYCQRADVKERKRAYFQRADVKQRRKLRRIAREMVVAEGLAYAEALRRVGLAEASR